MFDTRTTFLALSTGSLDLKTHFGRKNRKSLDSASAVTPAIFLRNTAEFSVNLIVHGNSIILRGVSSPGRRAISVDSRILIFQCRGAKS